MSHKQKINETTKKVAKGLFTFYNVKLAIRVAVFIVALVVYFIDKKS